MVLSIQFMHMEVLFKSHPAQEKLTSKLVDIMPSTELNLPKKATYLHYILPMIYVMKIY